ncbi:hypothetical protein ACFXHA_40800 [Nocardia sp. NPDC059240]|uniref:hypothetical protein n=1 Tax=Nocardia sp. NPDC059240 TaxID=3346786 RepID=UPI0036B66202
MAIAASALLASAGSSVAAWEAWRTARAVEDLGRASLAVGGAEVTVDPVIDGDATKCAGKSTDTFTGLVDVRNEGRSAVTIHVSVVLVGVRVSASDLGGPGLTSISVENQLAIPALSKDTYQVEVACDGLALQGRSVRLRVNVGGNDNPVYVSVPKDSVRFNCKSTAGGIDLVPC